MYGGRNDGADRWTDIQITPTTSEVASIVQGGLAYLTDIERRLAPYFERAEPRRRAMTYLWGLLSPAEANTWREARRLQAWQLKQKGWPQREASGRMVVIWDGALIHRSHVIKEFSANGAGHRIHLEPLPAYAPELNPGEGLWGHLKVESYSRPQGREIQSSGR